MAFGSHATSTLHGTSPAPLHCSGSGLRLELLQLQMHACVLFPASLRWRSSCRSATFVLGLFVPSYLVCVTRLPHQTCTSIVVSIRVALMTLAFAPRSSLRCQVPFTTANRRFGSCGYRCTRTRGSNVNAALPVEVCHAPLSRRCTNRPVDPKIRHAVS